MARKREEEEFVFPVFDEQEFMEKEMHQTKVTFITLGFAVVMAFVSFGLFLAVPSLVGFIFVFGILAIVNLPKVYELLDIDTSKFEKMNWFGNGMLTFFCWLAVWILLSNPPITDMADPTIAHVNIYKVDNATVEEGYLVVEDGKLVEFTPYSEGSLVLDGHIVVISMDIVDNYHLEEDSLMVKVTDPQGSSNEYMLETTSGEIREIIRTSVANDSEGKPILHKSFRFKDETYYLAYEFPKEKPGNYTFKISAKDSYDNSRTFTRIVNVE